MNFIENECPGQCSIKISMLKKWILFVKSGEEHFVARAGGLGWTGQRVHQRVRPLSARTGRRTTQRLVALYYFSWDQHTNIIIYFSLVSSLFFAFNVFFVVKNSIVASNTSEIYVMQNTMVEREVWMAVGGKKNEKGARKKGENYIKTGYKGLKMHFFGL